MGFFSKVNEYNIQLEKILENKYFSSNAKNLVLSMVYKIENSYNDYREVKRIRKEKEEFILEINETVEEYVDYVKLAEPNGEKAEILKKNNVLAVTNEKNGNILSYPTEIALLYAISDIKPKYFYIGSDIPFKNGMQKMLVYGYNQNNLEILTDFNGWSWDIENKEKNYIYNIIYQNLLMILGIKFMDQWMNYNSSDINFISNIRKKTSGTDFYYWLCRVIFLLEKNNESFIKRVNLKVEEYNKMANKKKYLEDAKKNKMKLTKAVEKIDQILNDEKLLKEEFIKKNKSLDKNKRIKNINYFKILLEKDRRQFMSKVKQMSTVLIPDNFLKIKEELELYRRLVIEDKGLNESIIELQKEFIKIMKNRVNKITTNDDLIDLIYQLRYYKNIFIDDEKQILDYPELKTKIKNLEKKIITVACKNSILRIFSMDINLNYEIISKILDTKIIELEQIKVKINANKEKLIAQVYDKEVFEKEFEITYSGGKEDLEIKKNKFVKLFV